ncbi:hypothetical protein CHU92_07545 [Flavobacterium cyanobacteriorum]|uniref:Uncharacterized protein n=1 Tax=Flavobacterium cyanobacteriorum TaxID=2022802 RepID=A0A255Z860_9FLAO|nr:hypothetical protein CHU92_07545 [Flavobacterium cyanobacteriorum]
MNNKGAIFFIGRNLVSNAAFAVLVSVVQQVFPVSPDSSGILPAARFRGGEIERIAGKSSPKKLLFLVWSKNHRV